MNHVIDISDDGGAVKRSPSSLLDYMSISRSQIRVIQVGNQYEIFRYSKAVRIGPRPYAVRQIEPLKKQYLPDELEEKRELRKIRNEFDSITKIRRYVIHNFKIAKFYTLTFDDKKVDFDIKDIKTCYKRFYWFIRKLKILYPSFKYIAVPEFQDKNGRGAVHFHFLADLPFIDIKDFSDFWGYGYCYIQKRRDILATSLYMSKYLTKTHKDPRFYKVRRYRKSNNVELPKILYGKAAQKMLLDLRKQKNVILLKRKFYNVFTGYIDHWVVREEKYDSTINKR